MVRKLLAVSFVLAIIALAGSLWLTRTPEQGDAAVTPATRVAEAVEPSSDVAGDREAEGATVREEAVPDSKAGTSAASGARPAPAGRWIGRCVDTGRMPVGNARVVIRAGASFEWSSTSAADGRFEVLLDEPLADRDELRAQSLMLEARGPEGAIAVQRVSNPNGAGLRGFLPPQDDTLPTADVGTVVLQTPCALDVSVSNGASAVAGARVEIESGVLGRTVLAVGSTNSAGAAHFDTLPAGPLFARATFDALDASTLVYLPDDASVSLALQPMLEFVVEVVDAHSQAPIPDATIAVHEHYPIPPRFDEEWTSVQGVFTSVQLDRPLAATNSEGRARLERLPSAGRYEIAVQAEGFVPLPDPMDHRSSRARLGQPGEVVRVQLRRAGGRTARWPVVAGEVPVPPDGAEIALRFAPGSGFGREELVLPSGRMQGTTLIVDGLAVGNLHLLARAPDGALCSLGIGATEELGKEVSFRRARKIDVTVRDADGAPVPGAAATARNQGNNPLCDFVRTDPEGHATLGGLYGHLADVYVTPPGMRGGELRAGSVDLEQGDGQVEVALPRRFFARAVVRIDGVPRLPARFTCSPTPLEELPERGELRFELVEPGDGESASIFLRAAGYLGASAKVAPSADGSEPVVELALSAAGELLIDVRRTPEQRVEISVERFDEQAASWGLAMLGGIRAPNGPSGGFRIAGLRAGRWRAIDKTTGIASEEAEIGPNALRARVVLELANVQWVTGRVEVPQGEDRRRAVVLVEGLDAEPGTRWEEPGEAPPNGARVAEDGTFKLRIPGDREVALRPWHPWLVPAEGSVVKTRAGLDGVVLRLAPGRELRIPAPSVADQGSSRLRIAAYAGELGSSPPQWIHAPIEAGVARTADLAPGRWTLWIDASERFAPITLRGVEVGEGLTTLAPLQLSPGSTIRVRVRAKGEEATPRIYVSATSLAEPVFWRDINSRGEREVVLSGLSAGRYLVSISAIMQSRDSNPREVELDGANEVLLDYDP